MKVIGIIPARYASTRFPGKPLAEIHGKSMIERVYRQAEASTSLSEVWVATDDDRIATHVTAFGGKVVSTLPSHESGTERCHEAWSKIGSEAGAVINIQGDEPYIAPEQIDQLAALIVREDAQIATLIKRISDTEDLLDPNKVKVVVDAANKALYFSRSAIPFMRDQPVTVWLKNHDYYKHLGIYAYRTEVLHELVHLESSALEKAEKLEQLRWLERGKSIHCGITKFESPSIDTPDDLERVLASRES